MKTTQPTIYAVLNHWYTELSAWTQVIQEKGIVQERYLEELMKQVKRHSENEWISKKQLEEFRRQLSLLRYVWDEPERLLEALETLLGFLYLLGKGAKLEPFQNVQKGIPLTEEELQSLCTILLEQFPALFEPIEFDSPLKQTENGVSLQTLLEEYAHDDQSGYPEWINKQGYSVNMDSVMKNNRG